MKKFVLFLFLLGTAGVVLDYYMRHRNDDNSYLEQLEHTLACADWEIYEDEIFGYEVRYPSCFLRQRTQKEGSCSFGYYEETITDAIPYMTLEVHTEVAKDSANPRREIYKLSQERGAIALQIGEGDFLMSGRLVSKDRHVTAWRYNSHYVLRQRMWFVLTLFYPEDFSPAVKRLTDEVDGWEPFRN